MSNEETLVKRAYFRMPIYGVNRGFVVGYDSDLNAPIVEVRTKKENIYHVVVPQSSIRYYDMLMMRMNDAKEENGGGAEAPGVQHTQEGQQGSAEPTDAAQGDSGVEAAAVREGEETQGKNPSDSELSPEGPVPGTEEVRKRPGKSRGGSPRKKSR